MLSCSQTYKYSQSNLSVTTCKLKDKTISLLMILSIKKICKIVGVDGVIFECPGSFNRCLEWLWIAWKFVGCRDCNTSVHLPGCVYCLQGNRFMLYLYWKNCYKADFFCLQYFKSIINFGILKVFIVKELHKFIKFRRHAHYLVLWEHS